MKTAYILYPFLIINTATDIFKRKICILSVMTAGILGAGTIFKGFGQSLLSADDSSLWILFAGVLFGGLLVLLSFVSSGSIGLGDGLVAAVLGLYLGIYKVVLLFMLSFLLSGIFGVILIICKKAGRKTRLPLMPFILISYTVMLFTS